jgi:hypothetical protein
MTQQVADEIIRTVVKRRKGSLLDLDESELADICPDSATLNSRYGGRYRVQDILVRRVMPHRLARLQQEVSGYLDLHDAKPLRVIFKKNTCNLTLQQPFIYAVTPLGLSSGQARGSHTPLNPT